MLYLIKMTLISEETNKHKAINTSVQMNEIFIKNKITSENIVKIITHNGEVIIIWDDGERPI